MAASYDNASITASLGAYVQPGIGQAYPELVADLKALYRNRVAKLPFVPVDWLARVLSLMGDDQVVKLQQPSPYGKAYTGPLPEWITGDQAARDAWQQAALVVDQAVFQFAYKQVEAGRAVIAKAQANAAFWDGLYRAAVAVRDAPGNAVAAVGRGALSFAGAFLAKAWWVLALAALAVLVWLNRGSVLAGASRRFKRAVQ